MIELLIAALMLVLACAVYLAWQLDERTKELDLCSDDWGRLFEDYGRAQVQARHATEELERYQRWVEQQSAADVEVARLRAANARLGLQLGQLSDRVQDYKEGLYESGHHDELQAFQKYLDGEHEDVLH